MTRNQHRAILGLIALVVVASGCTQSGGDTSVTVTENQGMTIDEFSAFPSSVTSPAGSPANVQLRAVVQNTGGAEAENVQLKVFNVPFSGSPSWSVNSGDDLGGSNVGMDFGASALTAPDPENGVPSTPREDTMELTAPGLASGVTIPYNFLGELQYDYETTGISQVQLMSEERFRDTGATRTKPSVDNSAGPIKMEVRTNTPIIFYSGSNTASQLCVIVRNVADGQPTAEGAKVSGGYSDVENSVELTVSAPNAISSTTTKVDLVGNRGVECFDFNSGLTSPDLQTTVPVTTAAKYRYTRETSTSVTVNGQ